MPDSQTEIRLTRALVWCLFVLQIVSVVGFAWVLSGVISHQARIMRHVERLEVIHFGTP